MRGSLVPLAVCVVASCPRCRSIPSFERFLSVPCCRTGNYFGGGQAFGALRQWSAVRPLGAGPVARALGSARGAPTPRGSPRATPGELLSLRSVFVGSRQPPTIRGTRHGRCVPRLQGAAALRGRV